MPTPTSFGMQLLQNTGNQAASGTTGGLLGQLFAGANARREWKYKQKEMALQQQYALEQMQKQAEYQYSNWQKQFDYENTYNDPTAIRDRWQKAGASLAAVLGSSGVGVNATMPGGSAGSIGASGPAGGSFSSAAGSSLGVFDPRAAAQNMVAKTEADRNSAAADQSRAEAQRINDQNLGKDYYSRAGELALQLSEANIKQSDAVSRNFNAAATWQEAQNSYADLIATAEWEKVVGEVGLITEEYQRLRAQNDADIPFMAQLAAANVSYLLAATSNLRASAQVSSFTARDMQKWYDLNWNSVVQVPDVDSSGKPNGRTVEMTGREIQELLFSISAAEGKQTLQSNWFEIRSRKNALGYSALQTVVKGATDIANAYVTRKIPTTTDSSRETTYVGDDGTVRGYATEQMRRRQH